MTKNDTMEYPTIRIYIICPDCGKISRLQNCGQNIDDDKLELVFRILDEFRHELSILWKYLR